MINDPIIEEIRQIRHTYAAKFNHDLHAICDDLRRQERESDREIRTPLKRMEEASRHSRAVTEACTGAREPAGDEE